MNEPIFINDISEILVYLYFALRAVTVVLALDIIYKNLRNIEAKRVPPASKITYVLYFAGLSLYTSVAFLSGLGAVTVDRPISLYALLGSAGITMWLIGVRRAIYDLYDNKEDEEVPRSLRKQRVNIVRYVRSTFWERDP